MKNILSDMIRMDNGSVNILHALQSKWVGTQWIGNGITYNGIEWLDVNEIPKPTENEINTEITRLQAEYDNLAYARNRKSEYNALSQFELISDDSINSTTTHKDAIVAIKTKWPKDNTGPVE